MAINRLSRITRSQNQLVEPRGAIYYLPEIRPDELFNSVLIRMLWHQADDMALNTYLTYRCQPQPYFSAILVPRLDRLQQICPEGWLDQEELLGSCCAFPFLSPFLMPDIRKRHLAWVSGKIDLRLSPAQGVGRWRVHWPQKFRVCPKCLANDIEEYGEPYLRRSHHLPGIDFCTEHRQVLVDIGNKYTKVSGLIRRMDRLSRCSGREVEGVSEKLLVYLKSAVRGLLDREIVPDEHLDFGRFYRLRLDLLGIPRRRWTDELIVALEIQSGTASRKLFQFEKWIHLVKSYILGFQPVLPPVAHLLLQSFLDIPFRDSLEFADGKFWRCANPFTDCGRANTEPRIPKAAAEIINCDFCGHRARVLRKSPLGARPIVDRILERGPVFEKSLLEAIGRGRSIVSLHRETGMSYLTLAKILKDLGIKPKRGGRLALQVSSKDIELKRAEYRRQLIRYLEANPDVTRKELAVIDGTMYDWLLRCDRDWYEANAPEALESSKTPPWLAQKSG